MKKLLLLFAIIAFGSSKADAQLCTIQITPMDTTICPGDSAFIFALANILNAGQAFDFNSGSVPSGWTTQGGTAFSQPCGTNPTGTPYYWASTVTAGNAPGISTAAFDVSCGGVIQFDMVFAIQSGSAPCEGPDLITEGVELQYSTNGGATWNSIIYYNPNGTTQSSQSAATGSGIGAGQLTPFTSWATYTITIPPGAITTSTMFQWTQFTNSGTCCDNWGIDNVIINATGPPCGSNSVVNWSTGLNDTTSFWMVPTGDTAFVAYVYDTLGNFQCQSDTVYVNVFDGNITHTLVDQANVYCPYDSVQVNITNIQNAQTPITYNWSNGYTTSNSYLQASGATPDTIMYYVDFTDGCGFVVSDSVQLLVNQTLGITGFTTNNQVNCINNGQAHVNVTGNIGPVGFSWIGPGSSGPVVGSTSTINNVPTGWYYVTVTDNVCQVSDSVFVDQTIVDNLQYNLEDTLTVYCPFDSIQAHVTNLTGAVQPVTYSWSTGSTTSTSYIYGGANEHDTLIYTVYFEDACGFNRTDTVVLVVNKLLNVDNLTMSPTTTCNSDGEVAAFVSGINGTPIYQWNDTLNHIAPGTGDSTTTLTWNNVGGSWYYFTVTDDYCSDSDSILVETLDPPIAAFSAIPDAGCVGMSSVLQNNSQNTTVFYWDFGNGNDTLVNNAGDQSQTYYQSTTVMLVAYLDASLTCSDTAYANINIVVCGCTDPLATNYDPNAVVDNGSCYYPLPEVIAPNIFTPNADDQNDIFFFTTINTVLLEVTITNRWGNLMYEQAIDLTTQPQETGWDGKAPSGTDAQEGTYFYKYKATGINGDITEGQGFLQLER